MTARRLAAILAADVVGYSRLMGEDEVGTAKIVRERREAAAPIVAAHGGRVFKTMGDGILIEFASVVAAVECALALQKQAAERNAEAPEAKSVVYRIGVHLGDVLVDGEDVLGDGVNIATRLEGVAEPGGVCVSGSAFDHVRGRVEAEFIDLGERALKNIARPVRVYALEVGEIARASGSTPPRPAVPVKPTAPALLGIAALLIGIAAGGWYLFIANRPAAVATGPPAPVASTATAPAEAKHLSIVVLPFTNLSGDPAQDYFADGITENLTTDLSRIRNSFVIARNTAFTYKGKNLDAKTIGKELGVRYVLEGSVQRDQNRVRVNAQLVDAESGAHLWADRFEEDVADLFRLQDQVVLRLANTLGIELVKAEAERGVRSRNPDAVDLTMRGWALARQWTEGKKWTKEKNQEARAQFEQALKIDPNNADALAGEAYTYTNEYSFVRSHETDYDPKILGPADQAIAIAPDTLWAYYAKCVYLYYSHRADKAIDAADAGLAIDPNFAPLLAVRGNANLFEGHFEQARSDILQGMRLNPRVPGLGIKYLGDAELGLGHFDAAIDDYHRAIDLGMHDMWPYASLAAASALAGKMDEAKAALAEALRLEPKLTIKFMTLFGPPVPNLFDGLRKVGLAEEAQVEPVHLSIVVLPFTNLLNDPNQDYFADGITENLTTDLSRIRNSFVIARNTAFTYKGKSIDAKAIGKELDVRYVLEGSVQRDQNRVRINAQLIDAESGAHLWADRFEEDTADLFKLQDQVVAQLANSLGWALTKAEAEKGTRSANPDAIDLSLRGWYLVNSHFSRAPDEGRDMLHQARTLFERALQIDPTDVDALNGTAVTYFHDFINGWGDPKTDYDAKLLGPANRAMHLAPDYPNIYPIKAIYLALSRRADEALGPADAGLALNPNDPYLYQARALAENSLGRYEQAKADVERAIRLSPRDPGMGFWHVDLGDAEINLGHFDAAIDEYHKALDMGLGAVFVHTNLAAAYAHAGKIDEAKAELAEARRLNPAITVKWTKEHGPNLPAVFEGLRKAGLPEE